MIEAKNISFAYDQKMIIDGLSLQIERGNFVGIVGPNGSGKSTLLRLLSGILKPKVGSIFVQDKNIAQIDQKDWACLCSFLPAQMDCVYDYTVKEIVQLARLAHKNCRCCLDSDAQIIERSMINTGVQHWADISIQNLSSGQRQMVFLAQILAQNTPLLMLDEPTVHLDISVQLQWCRLLQSYSRLQKVAVVAVLHDLNLAAQFCDRIVLMQQGKIFADGSSADVLSLENIQSVYGVAAKKVFNTDGKFQIFYN